MRGGMVALALVAALGGCAAVDTASKFAKPAFAGEDTAASTVDYKAFSALTGDVGAYRAARRVSLEQFQRMAREDGTLILDARSAQAYARGHISGAVNLPFTDFTAQSLAVNGDLPKISYFTRIDYAFLLTYIVLLVVALESIYAKFLNERNHALADRIDYRSAWVVSLAYVGGMAAVVWVR